MTRQTVAGMYIAEMEAIEKLSRAGWTITFPDVVGDERLQVRAKNGDADRGVFYQAGKLDEALAILAEKCELAPPQKPDERDADPLRVAGDPVDSDDQGEPRADDADAPAVGRDAAAAVVAKSPDPEAKAPPRKGKGPPTL